MSDLKDRYDIYGFKVDTEELKRGEAPVEVDFPVPIHKFKIIQESYNQNMEEIYYWIHNHLTEDWGLYKTKKITDNFSASEHSAFWGAANQRLQIVQGQVSNYLMTIGKLMQGLFQIVREIKHTEDRLILYKHSNRAINPGKADESKETYSSEIVLKGYWVDLKDGGGKSMTSIYGMASELGFGTLPDLFFNAPPMRMDQVDAYVNKLKFNRKVKEVLKRKLGAFISWKEATYKEIDARHGFQIKYLRQHYNSMRMYMNWVKPYLKRARRLAANEKDMDSTHLVSSFEASAIEIEMLAYRPVNDAEDAKEKYNAVVLANYKYKTRPAMEHHQDGYQHKGPSHMGKVVISLRSYAWTDKDLKNYERMRDDEALEIMADYDRSIKEAMDMLGDDMRRYLELADEKFPESKEEEEKRKAEEAKKKKQKDMDVLEPFRHLGLGFKEIISMVYWPKWEKSNRFHKADIDKAKSKAKGEADMILWQTFKNFKKSHGMVAW